MISLTSPVETRAHDWPAWAKLLGLCFATFALFKIESVSGQIVPMIAVAAAYSLPGRVFWRAGLQRLSFLWLFLAMIGLWHLLTGTITEGAVILMRLITAVALANLVTMTTRLTDMIAVIKWLATPLRFVGLNTRHLELAIALVIRFTPELLKKGNDLAQAWRARSARRPGWRIVLPFTLLAIDDAEYVAEALKARGGVSNGMENETHGT